MTLAAGTVLVGVAGYAFVAVAGQLFAPAEAAAVATLYTIANIVGPGVFLAVEHEVSRRTVFVVECGGRVLPVLTWTAARVVGMLGLVLLALAVCAPFLIGDAFAGHGGLAVVAAVTAGLTAMMSLVRGVLAGLRDVRGYAATLGAEGLGRLVLVGSALIAGPIPVGWYSAVFAAGTGCSALVGALCAWRWRAREGRAPVQPALAEPEVRGPAVHPGTAKPDATGGLPSLVVTTLLTYVMANVPVVVVTTRAQDAALAAAFAAGLLLARIPLFVFSPVQVLLLTALTGAVARAEHCRFRRTLRGGLAVALLIATIGLVGLFGFGAWASRELFGTRDALPLVILLCLVGGTTLLMAAQVLNAALVAQGRCRTVAMSWAAGAVVLAAVLVPPGDPVIAAVAAQVLGAGTAAVAMARQLRRLRAPPEGDVVPAGSREPLAAES
ncbi:hypothetical protein EIL87_05280 [Saccharopolyspora rhizosphaerae]|uniref:Polysaccharide biosynthesis protein n=1 Tax=Saccharopolyspora rhizosphaerae TaxID=2492662 RepID=A0A426K0K5_9PSEU|nr:hypothetical protein [Saccharopolyspora rhizosphaerae]RRO18920.1 hypothetical protein EIL87_05280 [Saccharopolyspora rhizosphaerae]